MRVIPNPRQRGTKRERTRNRLLVAAQELLLERSAGSLTIRDVSYQADLSHGTFYNYFDTIEALLDNLALLFTVTHARQIAELTAGVEDPAEVFALATRQTLRFVTADSNYGRYLFDVGLPLDYFARGLQVSLRADVQRGVETGAFSAPMSDLTISLVSGAMLGLALNMHRGSLPEGAIEDGTARLLEWLGVVRAKATRLASRPVEFRPVPSLPLTWLRGDAPTT